MYTENLKLSGHLNIVLTDKNGNIKDAREVKNLVVNAGLAYIANRIAKNTADSGGKGLMTHMALGSGGATPAAAGDTSLGATQLGNRKALTSTTITGTNSEKVQYVATFVATEGTGAVTEAGLFNASSGGDMLARTTFAVINKGADDTMTVTWTVTLSAA